jgi:hypothetical protein
LGASHAFPAQVPNLVVDLYFLLDIFVNFNTSSYDWEQAKYVLDRSVISREYLGSWFVAVWKPTTGLGGPDQT